MSVSDFNPFPVPKKIAKLSHYERRQNEGSSFWLDERLSQVNLFLSSHKVKLIFFVLLFSFLVLWGRVFWLQIVHGRQYALYANSNRLRQQIIPAERGIIYDRYLSPLVANVPKYVLYLTPGDLPASSDDRLDVLRRLSKLINYDLNELKELYAAARSHPYQPVLVSDKLTHQQVIKLKIVLPGLAGFDLRTEPRRVYLDNASLSHILGYVGKINSTELKQRYKQGYHLNDYIGKSGLELYYEKSLRGRTGLKEVEVNATGKIQKVLRQKAAAIGDNLVLSLDLGLQRELAQALKAALNSTPKATGAVGIALDPHNGEVLALVSLPDYDNNSFSAGISALAYQHYLNDPHRPLFDRAISGTYPPGSTFKPLVALAALEDHIINVQTSFLSTGGLRIGHWFFPDWKAGGHGRTNVIKAIAESVNTFFYYIGGGYKNFHGLGVKRIVSFARRFYLGRTLGIDLPGEAKGFLPTPDWKEKVKKEKWYIGDTYHLAIGQGDILVTPLQVAAYTAAIANGGTLYRPHLVKKIKSGSDRDSAADKFNSTDYVLKKHLASTDNINLVRLGMRTTVLKGSARSLQLLPVAAAGKTGTAQVGQHKYHAWFTGFAPFDSPQIVLTIMIENGGEGSSVAVPVFRRVLNWYFNDAR